MDETGPYQGHVTATFQKSRGNWAPSQVSGEKKYITKDQESALSGCFDMGSYKTMEQCPQYPGRTGLPAGNFISNQIITLATRENKALFSWAKISETTNDQKHS